MTPQVSSDPSSASAGSSRLLSGMTSVTFRKLGVEAVVGLARQAGLDVIEWGGDVHVPPGDLAAARRARRLTEDAGLSVCSYGSYHRASSRDQPIEPHLDVAVELGARSVRVWAGSVGSDQADEATRARVAEALHHACDLAAGRDLRIDLEYHSQTLTDTLESTLELLDRVDSPTLRCYWQPRHGCAVPDADSEIRALGDRLSHLHVFHWWPDPRTRWPLEAGADRWRVWLQTASRCPSKLKTPRAAILEFVRNDDPDQFLLDASVLRRLIDPTANQA